MSREIRVTIDDDEVFDRMKHRKQQLDLSWEEVLRRGLRHDPHGDIDHWGRARRGERPRYGPSDDFGEEIARRVQTHVANTLRDSMEGVLSRGSDVMGPSGPDVFESELGSLEGAENATLAFPFLDEEASQIPLRVNLRTSADGLDVDVVTIRRGKTVSGMNQFTPTTRKEITEHLARGEAADLRLATDDEAYRVFPALSWSRDSRGNPMVTAVEIEDVSFE